MIVTLVVCCLALAQAPNPQRAKQLIAEGIHLVQQEQLDEAADRFRKAIEADPNDADARNLPYDIRNSPAKSCGRSPVRTYNPTEKSLYYDALAIIRAEETCSKLI